MKQAKYYLMVMFLFLGCNGNMTENIIETDGIPSTKAAGDGKYDLLGYGYDCTFSAFKGSFYSKARVIDLDRFLSGNGRNQQTGEVVVMSPAGNIEESVLHSGGEVVSTWGSNLEEYTSGEHSTVNISATINNLDVKLFSADLKSFVNDTSRFSNMYCYYRVDTKKATRRLVMSEVYPSYLKHFLTDEFLNNLEYYTGDQMVEKYGTHVLTNILLGGIGSAVFTAKMTSTTNERSFRTEANLFIGNISTGTTNAEAQTRFQEFKDVNITVKTFGGTVAVDQGDIGFDPFTGKLGQISFNFRDWLNSVTKEAEQLIGIGDNTTRICLISEFVDDPVKKKEIEDAIARYCEKQKINMVNKKTLDYEKATISFPIDGGKTCFVTYVDLSHLGIPDHMINRFDVETTTPPNWTGFYFYWTFYPYGDYFRLGVRAEFKDYALINHLLEIPEFNESDLSQLWVIEQIDEDKFMLKHELSGLYMGHDLLMHPKNPNDKELWFNLTISE